MKIKILFIAPYKGLKELATVLAKQQSDLDILIEEADLSAAIPIVKANEKNGIQFIISRGGTAELIRQYTNIPVIEIKLSGYDFIRTLTLIKDYQMKVHMIGFPTICNAVLSISNLLNIKIAYTIVYHKEEVEKAVKEAWDEGAQLILGDTITVNTAENFGLQGMLMTTGKEAVLEVFDQVKQMNTVIEQLENEHSIYKEFLNSMQDGVLIFQEDGKIVYSNQQFEQKQYMSNTKKDQLSIFSLPEDLLNLITKSFNKTVAEFNISENIVLHGESFHVSAGRFGRGNENLYYVKLYDKNLEVRKNIEIYKGRTLKTSFAQIVTNSPIMNNVLLEAKIAAEENGPLIIWGDKGVGKKFLASSIHSESKFKEEQLIELIILNNSNKVIDEIKSFLSSIEKTTIYVTGLELLSIEQQREVIEVLSIYEHIRFIYTFHSIYENEFIRDITNRINGISIYMPTLRERIEDLEELIRLFVSSFNAQFGKQVVGVKGDALSYLRDFEWSGNVKQLKNMVKELVIISEGDYLGKEDIASIHLGETAEESGYLIDIAKTLSEIEREIINKVLKDENMNQTKAAKRLGINRTTLWRKLN